MFILLPILSVALPSNYKLGSQFSLFHMNALILLDMLENIYLDSIRLKRPTDLYKNVSQAYVNVCPRKLFDPDP